MRQQIDFQDELMKFAYSRQEHADMRHLQEAKDNHIPLNIGAYLVVRDEDGKAPNKLAVRWLVSSPQRIDLKALYIRATVQLRVIPMIFMLLLFNYINAHRMLNAFEAKFGMIIIYSFQKK